MFDNTEWDKTEDALARSEALYSNLFENASIGMFQTSLEGRFLRINEAFAVMLGYESPEEVISTITNTTTQIHSDPRNRLTLLAALEQHDWFYAEQPYLRKDGSTMIGKLAIRKVVRQDGTTAYLEGIVEDITERKQAEERLINNERKYRQLVDNVNSIILHLTSDGRIKFLNRFGQQFFGYSEEEIVGRHVVGTIVPEIESTGRELHSLVTQVCKDPAKFEKNINENICRNGERVWIEWNNRFVFDDQGKVVSILSIGNNITERTRMESALRESEVRFRTLFEDSPIALWEEDFSEVKTFLDGLRRSGITDIDAHFDTHPESLYQCAKMVKVLSVNRAALEMLQYDQRKDLQTYLSRIFREDSYDTFRMELVSLASGNKIFQTETINHNRHGERVYVNMTVAILPGHEENWSRVFVSFKDITEQVRMREELKAREARFRSYFELPLHGIAVISPDKRWIQVNDRLCSILGYNQDEITRSSCTEIIHPDDLADCMEKFDGLLSGKSNQYTVEVRAIHKDGSIIWVGIAAGCVQKPNGVADYIVAAVEDITDRKQQDLRIEYITRLLETLSQVNLAIVHSKSREELFQTICRVAVDYGKFDLAWVGLLDWETGQVTPVSCHGQEHPPLPFVSISVNDVLFKDGLMAAALNTGDIAYSQNIESEPLIQLWYGAGLLRDVHSAASIPFRLHGEIVGFLNIIANDGNFFAHQKQHNLLEEIGADISFALETFESAAERQTALEALQHSEASLVNAQRIAHLGNWDWKIQTNESNWSDELYRIFGLTPRQNGVTYETFLSMLHPADVGWVKQAVDAVLHDQKPYDIEYRIILPDGTERFVHGIGEVTLDTQGKPLLMSGTVLDITSTKLMEEKLMTAMEGLERASTAASVALWDWDFDSGKLEWSTVVDKMLGFEPGGFPRSMDAWNNIIHPDDKQRVFDHLKRHLVAATPYEIDYRVRKKDGSYAWWHDIGDAVRDKHGVAVNMSGACVDITERRQTEDMLQLERAKMMVAMENVAFGVVVCDRLGGNIWMNPAAMRIHGFVSTSDMISYADGFIDEWQLHYPDGRSMPFKEWPLFRAIQGDYVRGYEAHLSNGERNLEWNCIYNTIPVLDENDEVALIVMTLQDITEQKEAERNRLAREVAEESNRAKSAFVAHMSHEIRTPLNSVLGFGELLERDDSLTERQKEYVQAINRSGMHLLGLINDILEFSKIEAGKTSLNEAPFRIYEFLKDLEMMFRLRTDKKGLRLIVEWDESVPQHVIADEGKLRQIMVNLMGNAVKFTDTGEVKVRVHADSFADKPLKGVEKLRLSVEVEDSGPGIPEEDVDRIFDVFQQSKSGVQAGGTGLGLSISRDFVRMLGGELTVQTEVGKGSCFCFYIPVGRVEDSLEREEAGQSPVIDQRSYAGPFRVLVVDDVPNNRILLKEMLDLQEFEVREAGSGEEALGVVDQWSPHIVLMDLRMPGMDGYEATQRIKASETGRNTPVIAVTARSLSDLSVHYL